MSSNDSFGHLKHKLWPKEGSGVKLAIWLPTIKSRESIRFPCVQVVCDISLKSFQQWAITLFQTSSPLEVYTQSYGTPKSWESQLWEFWDSHLGVPGQNDIWVLVPWPGTKYTIRGKVVASPKFGSWWVLWIYVCPWFVRALKCSNYALTNLRFGLCRSVWIIELLVILPSSISKLQHTPLPWSVTN
jgi:hypothetical protein